MDITKKNEVKQAVKSKLFDTLQEELILIFNEYEIPYEKRNRIIKDILIWANLVIDAELV